MASCSRKRKANAELGDNGGTNATSVASTPRSHGTLSARKVLTRQQQREGAARLSSARSEIVTSRETVNPNQPRAGLDYDSEAGMESDASNGSTAAGAQHQKSKGLMSTWTAADGNHTSLGHDGERLKLEYNDIITIVGQYRIKVLYGVISIYGAILTARSPRLNVIAPTNQCVPSLRCVSGDWAEIELTNVLEKELIQQMERVNPTFGSIWRCRCAKCSVHASQRTYSKLRRLDEYHQNRNIVAIASPPAEWQPVLSSLIAKSQTRKHPRPVAIIGFAGANSSLSVQWMINMLLSSLHSQSPKSVILMDLQTEEPIVGLPGHVSLSVHSRPMLEPSWFRCNVYDHQDLLINSYAAGLDLAKRHELMSSLAERVLQDVTQIWDSKEHSITLAHLSSMSQGASKSSLLSRLASLNVQDVVLMGSSNDDETSKFLSAKGFSVTSLLDMPFPRRMMSTSERRAFSLQCYFHSRHQTDRYWDLTPISSWRPYELPYEDHGNIDPASRYTKLDSVIFCKEIPSMHANLIHNLINGSLVAIKLYKNIQKLGHCSVVRGAGDNIPHVTRTDPMVKHTEGTTLGMALIRSIDTENQVIHLLSPLALTKVGSGVVRLIAGIVDTPAWAFEEDMRFREWSKRSVASSGHEFFAKTSSTAGYPWIDIIDN